MIGLGDTKRKQNLNGKIRTSCNILKLSVSPAHLHISHDDILF